MKVFVSSQNTPIGYTTPPFPSIYWPLGSSQLLFDSLFLYYATDIWRFTVLWSVIFFTGVYTLVGISACFNVAFKGYRFGKVTSAKRSYMLRSIMIALLYVLSGAAQGFLAGAIVGLMLQAIYRAGALTMSTWIPFCWGFALIMYHICSSYSTSLMLM